MVETVILMCNDDVAIGNRPRFEKSLCENVMIEKVMKGSDHHSRHISEAVLCNVVNGKRQALKDESPYNRTWQRAHWKGRRVALQLCSLVVGA